MFKGNLIENQKYYSLRNKQLLYMLLPSITIGLFVNFYQMSIGVTIGAIMLSVVVIFLTLRNQKEILNVTKKRIEISQNTIELKEASGKVIETISIDEDAKLILKNDYKMAQETMKDIKEEIKGNIEKHFIVVEINNIQKRFDFTIDSHYMLNQLKKIVQLWQKETLSIEYVE